VKKNYYVTRRGDQWTVRREGAERASHLFDTQRQAIDRGRELAKETHGELRIQGVDHRFRDSDSYGNDSFPPRDEKH